jgi:toxin CcdB
MMHITPWSQPSETQRRESGPQACAHRNCGKQKDTIPFVINVQSGLFDGYPRRVVIPLVRKVEIDRIPKPRLNPTFKIKNVAVALHPLEIVSVASENLGVRVGSLAPEGDAIVAALDELVLVIPPLSFSLQPHPEWSPL